MMIHTHGLRKTCETLTCETPAGAFSAFRGIDLTIGAGGLVMARRGCRERESGPSPARTRPRADSASASAAGPQAPSTDRYQPCIRIPGYTRLVRAHEWIDRRSLALHEAVAAKLEAEPQLLDVARANLQRWLSTNPASALREWWRLLETTSLPELLVLLRSTGEQAARLRQSSPFAGLLTPHERQTILNDYESRRA